ncbi:MAG TPA: hypothetical protein DEF41_00700 [Desulfovibrio sp.]|nr:hypothetical protein [Desulfovibrio sp.]
MINNKSSFMKGLLLLVSFAAVFVVIMTPVFPTDSGKKENGLHYADDLFNKLSKGSSYFIPEVQKKVDGLAGKQIDLAVTVKKANKAADAAKVFTAAGMTATAEGEILKVKGDLGALLSATVKDADSMYHNDAAAVSARYGMEAADAMEASWEAYAGMIKALQKAKLIPESQAVDMVMKKAIEPGYNFYGINAAKVTDKMGIMTGLLVFYVIYTMWYGFAIFELFEGIGLTMKKSKVKQEA